jgi:hypothetical protein
LKATPYILPLMTISFFGSGTKRGCSPFAMTNSKPGP